MAELLLPKQIARVRFPSPAPVTGCERVTAPYTRPLRVWARTACPDGVTAHTSATAPDRHQLPDGLASMKSAMNFPAMRSDSLLFKPYCPPERCGTTTRRRPDAWA